MRNEKLGQATDFDDPSLRNELYQKEKKRQGASGIDRGRQK